MKLLIRCYWNLLTPSMSEYDNHGIIYVLAICVGLKLVGVGFSKGNIKFTSIDNKLK